MALRRQTGGHGGQSPRRTTGAARRPDRRGPPGHRVLHRRPRSRRRRTAGRVRHLGASRVEPGRRVQRGAHPGHHPGDRRISRRPRHHRAVVHRPRHPRTVRTGLGLRVRSAGGQRCCSAGGLRRPLHPDPGGQPRDPGLQPRPQFRAGRRDRRHPVAQPAPRRGVQVQPAQRRPRRHRRHRRNRQARQRDSARRVCRGEASSAGPCAGTRPAPRLSRRLRGRPPERGRHRCHPLRGGAHRRRPAGRGQRRLLGGDRRAAQSGPHGGQPPGGSDLAVHDPGHRRQDPDGLQFAQRDGLAHRQPGALPDRHRQRRRRRPARHRHPRRRAAQPQPLPGGGHRLPLHPPPRLAGRCGRR